MAQVEFDKKHLVPLTQEVVTNTQLEYNAMLVGVFELLKAKQEQIEAGKSCVEALKDYWIARADLKKAVGGNISEGAAMNSSITSTRQTSPQQVGN